MPSTAPHPPRPRPARAQARRRTTARTIDAILDEAIVCHVGFIVRRPAVRHPDAARPRRRHRLPARLDGQPHGPHARRRRAVLADGRRCSTGSCSRARHFTTRPTTAPSRSSAARALVDVRGGADARARGVHRAARARPLGARAPARTRKEMKATQVLALALDEASAKVRTGPPVDDDEDMDRDVWAGELPLALEAREPRPTRSSPTASRCPRTSAPGALPGASGRH